MCSPKGPLIGRKLPFKGREPNVSEGRGTRCVGEFAPPDEEVIKGVVERIRGALLQEIQDMNAGNPALAMISLPPASVPVRQPVGA